MNIVKRFLVLVAVATAVVSTGSGTADAARKTPPSTGPMVLVDQMGGYESAEGWDPLSQHKPDGTEIQSAADDFTVPNLRTWTLTKLEVGGSRLTPSTSSSLLNESPSFAVTVYKADGVGGTPGTEVTSVRVTPTTTSCCIDADGQLFELPNIALGAGRYWISAAYVHDPLLDNGKWFWRGYGTSNGAAAQYHSPTSGGWKALAYPHDLELRLTGRSS